VGLDVLDGPVLQVQAFAGGLNGLEQRHPLHLARLAVAGHPLDKVEIGNGQDVIRVAQRLRPIEVVDAYALPTETARIDLTTVSVYHQPLNEDGLLRFGCSKDQRPDLRQFKVLLGTLNPVGLPLATVDVACIWSDSDTAAVVTWTERRLVVQSTAHAPTQRAALHDRLTKAQTALAALNTKPATDRVALEQRAQAILTRDRVTDYLSVSFRERVTCQTRYGGRGRPGPNRPTHTSETLTWTVTVRRRPAAIAEAERLAGWRLYVTNTAAQRLSLAGAVQCYRQEWQPEHGFHRLKGGCWPCCPSTYAMRSASAVSRCCWASPCAS
jgi:transposase